MKIGVLLAEVFNKGGSFRSPALVDEKTAIVDDGVDVARKDLQAGLVGVFGCLRVAVVREKISVGDGHVGIILRHFIAGCGSVEM